MISDKPQKALAVYRRMMLGIFPLCLSLTSFAGEENNTQPNFVVIITDDQRPDTIHALGNKCIATPNLDRLSRDGMVFTRATCGFPLCVPSRSEILTGATAFRTGVPYGNDHLNEDLVFWGESLRDAGYHTWYAGKWMNDGTPHTRGYEETSGLMSAGGADEKNRETQYDCKGRRITGYPGWTFKTNEGIPELEKGIGLTGEANRHVADGAIALLERRPDKPFFLHVNFTGPHDPGQPHVKSLSWRALRARFGSRRPVFAFA